MAGKGDVTVRGLGIVLMVVGIGLGVWGYQESQSLGNELVSALGGRITDEVLAFYIAGAACLALGLFLVMRR